MHVALNTLRNILECRKDKPMKCLCYRRHKKKMMLRCRFLLLSSSLVKLLIHRKLD